MSFVLKCIIYAEYYSGIFRSLFVGLCVIGYVSSKELYNVHVYVYGSCLYFLLSKQYVCPLFLRFISVVRCGVTLSL